MPDRYGDDGREVSYTSDVVWQAERHRVEAQAVLECELCDDDGYTAGRNVCDHRDHTEAAARGMSLIRQQMGWKP